MTKQKKTKTMIEIPKLIEDAFDNPFWTPPNILSVGRLALLPFIVFLLFGGGFFASWLALILYAIGAVSDFFDGYLARKYNAISDFGTFIDPISDKIYVMSVFIALIAAGSIGYLLSFLVILIMTREFLVSGLREFLGPRDVQLPVTTLAKWKTTAQLITCGFLILAPVYPWAYWLGTLLMFGTTGITLYTGWEYLIGSLAHFTTARPVTPQDDESTDNGSAV